MNDRDLHLSSVKSDRASPVDVAVVALCIKLNPDTPNQQYDPLGTYHLLITKRLANTFYPGYWELPGGKLEPNEAPPDAARREAREELGIDIVVDAVLPPILHTYDHATVRLHTCVARLVSGSPEPRDLQVAAHRWSPMDCLPWENFLPANARVITALARYLAQPR